MTASAAARVASLLAGQPGGFGGVHLRAPASAARDTWLVHLRARLPAGTPWVKVPAGCTVETLLGGLDLPATLALGRPVARPGLLARAHGGVLLLAQAERATTRLLACVQQALDLGCVRVERDGLQEQAPARFCLVLLDESHEEEEGNIPAGLLDRLCFSLPARELQDWCAHAAAPATGAALEPAAALPAPAGPAAAPGASAARREPAAGPDPLTLLCASALELGIASLRAPLQAWQVANALAGLQAKGEPDGQDLAEAACLVYTARATRLPASADALQAAPETASSAPEAPPPAPQPERGDASAEPPPAPECAAAPDQAEAQRMPPPGSAGPDPEQPRSLPDAPGEQLVDSVLASLPPDLLARLACGAGSRGSGRASASATARKRQSTHGRPVGSQRGDPRGGLPLDLLGTVRAALPWQRLRQPAPSGGARLAIRAPDLRVRRLKPRLRSTAVFAVDASGSAALHRLNEAKGAVASLLAQCYVRRDQVALVSFRGAGARVCLPPTRSLARVHRELAGLPGGGGTPLAAGLQAAGRLAGELRRRGEAPLVVLLTDGRANVTLDGTGGRGLAEQQALAEAAVLRASAVPALLVDIAPQPQARARALAQAMAARYLALPAASAQSLAAAVARHLPSQGSRHG